MAVNSNKILNIFIPEHCPAFYTNIKVDWKYLISCLSKLLSWKHMSMWIFYALPLLLPFSCESVAVEPLLFKINLRWWRWEDVSFRSQTHHYTRRIKPNPTVVLIRCWQTFICVSLCMKKKSDNTMLHGTRYANIPFIFNITLCSTPNCSCKMTWVTTLKSSAALNIHTCHSEVQHYS